MIIEQNEDQHDVTVMEEEKALEKQDGEKHNKNSYYTARGEP
jgi:hypothetical protein